MTHTIDKFMVKAGFDARQVEQVRFRPALYSGIMSMLLCSGLFLALIVL